MNEQMHALAYLAGANSIFYGEKLLTTPNPKSNTDMDLFRRLGISPEERSVNEAPVESNPLFYEVASSNTPEASTHMTSR
jgi:biotin synthase